MFIDARTGQRQIWGAIFGWQHVDALSSCCCAYVHHTLWLRTVLSASSTEDLRLLPQKENWNHPLPSRTQLIQSIHTHTLTLFFSSHLLSVHYFYSSLPFVSEIDHWVPQRLVLPPAHCGACLHFCRGKGLTLFCPRRLASLPLTPSGLPAGHGRYLCFPRHLTAAVVHGPTVCGGQPVR